MAATIFPLYDMVRVIGGSDVRVKLVLPPGEPLSRFADAASSFDFATVDAVFAAGARRLDGIVLTSLEEKNFSGLADWNFGTGIALRCRSRMRQPSRRVTAAE